MLKFVAKRLLITLPLVLVIITLTFFLIRIAPGRPFSREQAVPPEIQANLERHYGLDRPWHVQYWNYLRGLARFDLGPSYRFSDVSVNEIIFRGLPISARIGMAAYLLALVVGIPLGVLAAVKDRSLLARAAMSLVVLGVSVPNFVLGPLLVLVFCLTFYWLPPAGWGEARHYVLPVLTLSAAYVAYIARLTRTAMLEALRQDFVRTARAKGTTERRVIVRHALRRSLLPVVSFTGPSLAFLLTGTVVVERIFAIPGLGNFFIQAAFNRDYTLILGVVLFVALTLIILNLLVDAVYMWLDPRIKYGQ